MQSILTSCFLILSSLWLPVRCPFFCFFSYVSASLPPFLGQCPFFFSFFFVNQALCVTGRKNEMCKKVTRAQVRHLKPSETCCTDLNHLERRESPEHVSSSGENWESGELLTVPRRKLTELWGEMTSMAEDRNLLGMSHLISLSLLYLPMFSAHLLSFSVAPHWFVMLAGARTGLSEEGVSQVTWQASPLAACQRPHTLVRIPHRSTGRPSPELSARE